MSGATMPEPLAMPAMRTTWPSMAASAWDPLGKVSVVVIARAAARHAPASRLRTRSGTRARIFASSSETPMTPVEASMTSRRRQPKRLATAAATRAAARSPGLPVKELAHPAFTTNALAAFLPRRI